MKDCNRCNGTGRVTTGHNERPLTHEESEAWESPALDGSKLVDWVSCTACGGTGGSEVSGEGESNGTIE